MPMQANDEGGWLTPLALGQKRVDDEPARLDNHATAKAEREAKRTSNVSTPSPSRAMTRMRKSRSRSAGGFGYCIVLTSCYHCISVRTMTTKKQQKGTRGGKLKAETDHAVPCKPPNSGQCFKPLRTQMAASSRPSSCIRW